MAKAVWARLAPVVVGMALAAGLGACSDDGGDDEVGASGTTAGTEAIGDGAAEEPTDDSAADGEPSDEPTPADEATADGASVTAPEHPGGHPHWSYEGDTGPESWAGLDPEAWGACAGERQSPIDISGAVDGEAPALDVAYAPAPLTVRNNGHSVETQHPAGSEVSLDGEAFPFVGVHFHVNSEHTVDELGSPLELHFVNRVGEGSAARYAVLGVLVEEGDENAAAAPLVASLPGATAEFAAGSGELDPAALLPEDRTFFHYDGSLTTPGCAETVSWQVFATPIEMSAAQIVVFTDLFPGGNARPVQDRNGREVVLVGDA